MQLVTELVEMARLDETRLDPDPRAGRPCRRRCEAAVSVDGSGAPPQTWISDRVPRRSSASGSAAARLSNIVDTRSSTADGGEIGSGCGGTAGRSPWTSVTRVWGSRPPICGRLFTRFGRIVTTATGGDRRPRAWASTSARTGPQAGRRRHRHLRGGPGWDSTSRCGSRNDRVVGALRDLSSPSGQPEGVGTRRDFLAPPPRISSPAARSRRLLRGRVGTLVAVLAARPLHRLLQRARVVSRPTRRALDAPGDTRPIPGRHPLATRS